MGALANAVAIMNNATWRLWMTAASGYVARQVYSEPTNTPDYAIRRRLALDVLTQPDKISSRLGTLLAADNTLMTLGSTPETLPENEIINRVTTLWTKMAQTEYPPETP